jgi:hypothetical protein
MLGKFRRAISSRSGSMFAHTTPGLRPRELITVPHGSTIML